ncbi:hypothetical protein C8Q79DRAFT_930637 [Trametes meyenii]|nr:hypothetical protein C8Q79DRAFT_930637 [Trametes meyenii]
MSAASSSLGTLRCVMQNLVEEATREDMPTRLTLCKWCRCMVADLPCTEPRETFIRRWCQRGISGVGNQTFLAEHLPLPEEDAVSSAASPGPMAAESPVEIASEERENEPSPADSPPELTKLGGRGPCLAAWDTASNVV